jgi:hypothetical protein
MPKHHHHVIAHLVVSKRVLDAWYWLRLWERHFSRSKISRTSFERAGNLCVGALFVNRCLHDEPELASPYLRPSLLSDRESHFAR